MDAGTACLQLRVDLGPPVVSCTAVEDRDSEDMSAEDAYADLAVVAVTGVNVDVGVISQYPYCIPIIWIL